MFDVEPSRPVKCNIVVDKENVVKAAIRHELGDEDGIILFKATAQEDNQVSVASGADDSCFIHDGLL